MIDTYMDMADTRTGWRWLTHPGPELRPDPADDPRFWGGHLYDSPISAQAAAARARLKWALVTDCSAHKLELRHNIKMGSHQSAFTANGQRKKGANQ